LGLLEKKWACCRPRFTRELIGSEVATRKEAQRATTTERLGLVALSLQSVALIKLEGTEVS